MKLFPTDAKHRKQIVLLTALAIGSGVFQWLVLWFELDPTENPPISPGVIFGATLAVYLFFARKIRPLRGLGLIIATTAIWNVAVHSAIDAFDSLPGEYGDRLNLFIAGLPAGFLGSALLIISLSVLFGYFRSWRLRAITVALATVLGGLLLGWGKAGEPPLLLLFTVWQGVFAYCFSLALAEEDI